MRVSNYVFDFLPTLHLILLQHDHPLLVSDHPLHKALLNYCSNNKMDKIYAHYSIDHSKISAVTDKFLKRISNAIREALYPRKATSIERRQSQNENTPKPTRVTRRHSLQLPVQPNIPFTLKILHDDDNIYDNAAYDVDYCDVDETNVDHKSRSQMVVPADVHIQFSIQRFNKQRLPVFAEATQIQIENMTFDQKT